MGSNKKSNAESKWITTLRTTYSHSFDDKISNNIKSTNNEIIFANFPSLKRIWQHTNELSISLQIAFMLVEFIFKLKRHFIETTRNAKNYLQTQIASVNKKSLRNIVRFLSDEILRLSYEKFNKFYKPDPSKIKRETTRNYLPCYIQEKSY